MLEVIFQRLPNTILLATSAMMIAILLGVPLGFLAAYNKGTISDTFIMILAISGISMPHFWLGLILLFIFAVDLGWLPLSGSGLLNLVLPALTLGISKCCYICQIDKNFYDRDFTTGFCYYSSR